MEKRLVLITAMILIIVLFLFALIFRDSFNFTGNTVVIESQNHSLPDINVSLVKPFTLSLGQSALIPSENINIKFSKILEDSRCPINVKCVQAGRAVIEVDFVKDNKKSATVRLADKNSENDSISAELFYYNLKLTSVYPDRISNKTIPDSQYLVTLVVSHL